MYLHVLSSCWYALCVIVYVYLYLRVMCAIWSSFTGLQGSLKSSYVIGSIQ